MVEDVVIEVRLGLKDDTPTLPQVIKVPVVIMNETGLGRRVTLSERNQVVPKALRDWMLNDSRYADWFKDEPEQLV